MPRSARVHRQLMAHLPFLARAIVHVDPTSASGEDHHHAHDHSAEREHVHAKRDHERVHGHYGAPAANSSPGGGWFASPECETRRDARSVALERS